uniref:Uncharacterized protein n=1 Tax=Anopheles farauti TaxID=69004 RepID=A0A182QT14_9DIPT
MTAFVKLLLATALLTLVFYRATADDGIDQDKVFCGHLDCRKIATYKKEKFCNPCDNRHYCECVETSESLPYLRSCSGSTECQTRDRLGRCQKTLSDDKCKLID